MKACEKEQGHLVGLITHVKLTEVMFGFNSFSFDSTSFVHVKITTTGKQMGVKYASRFNKTV